MLYILFFFLKKWTAKVREDFSYLYQLDLYPESGLRLSLFLISSFSPYIQDKVMSIDTQTSKHVSRNQGTLEHWKSAYWNAEIRGTLGICVSLTLHHHWWQT